MTSWPPSSPTSSRNCPVPQIQTLHQCARARNSCWLWRAPARRSAIRLWRACGHLSEIWCLSSGCLTSWRSITVSGYVATSPSNPPSPYSFTVIVVRTKLRSRLSAWSVQGEVRLLPEKGQGGISCWTCSKLQHLTCWVGMDWMPFW